MEPRRVFVKKAYSASGEGWLWDVAGLLIEYSTMDFRKHQVIPNGTFPIGIIEVPLEFGQFETRIAMLGDIRLIGNGPRHPMPVYPKDGVVEDCTGLYHGIGPSHGLKLEVDYCRVFNSRYRIGG